jgi:soluble lytic murein transglycosylase
VRFGTFYIEIVQPVAEAYDFHPLFLWSVMRQESLFEGFIRSSAGARGLMQVIPSTGQAIYEQAGWPDNYSAEDLYRPKVSITYGADYLADQRTAFDGDLLTALAAYNGGPGNAFQWSELAQGDPDLFVEVIRFEETRNYLRGITEIFSIYREIYDRTP